MNVRETLEEKEKKTLSPFAALSSKSKGRQFSIKPCPLRTEFQRDRDRIIHSKAFRRLSHKTQVFLSPEGDHYRTRLIHTLEVSQISRVIARALRLNEDLTEAIALAHDLGHTPFGHIGEEALTECLQQLRQEGDDETIPEVFKHNEQSLRVVDLIEYEGKGLNLTWEVRDGILNHTGEVTPATPEGQIVKIADRIAYINHDIDDAIRANILKVHELPQAPLEILGKQHGVRISNMVMDMVANSEGKDRIQTSDEFARAMNELRDFLMVNIYTNSPAKTEDDKAKMVLKSLFFYFLNHPKELPSEFQASNKSVLIAKVCDYVAGMTDRYALKVYEDLFIPQRWMV